jgi:hypothetical protein
MLNLVFALQQVIAINNVSVIPMDRERVLPAQTVVIRNGRIAEIGPRRSVTGAGVIQVDGTGKFLIPGLAEMHGHIGAAATNPRTLALFALNGVTFTRGMLGAPPHLALRDSLERGLVFGPRMITSSPSFNQNSASTIEAAMNLVRASKDAGYDFLKIHPGVPRVVFDSIDALADRLGIRFAGHVPFDVGLDRAIATKYWTVDHIDGVVELLYNGSAPLTQQSAGLFGINLIGQIDESGLPAIVRRLREAGIAVVPTNELMENHASDATGAEITARDDYTYWIPQQVTGWRNQKDAILANSPLTPAQRAGYVALRRRILKALHDGGVPILLGADAPQLWNVPGFSTHREMHAYVRAGLTPFQALQTGTVNIARAMGEEGRAGVVAQGARADLILLDANPLVDITNSLRISGVVLNGKWIPATERMRRLSELATR